LAQRGSEGPAVLAIQAVFTGAAPDLLRWLVRWPPPVAHSVACAL